MSKKEMEQVKVFELLKMGQLSQQAVAMKLKLTTRTIRKKYPRYLKFGDQGIIHLNRGSSSPLRWSKEEEFFAMNLLKCEWEGFGPTFAAEKLKEIYNIQVSKETLRKRMIENGLWQGKKRKIKHRQRRERKHFFGEMIQLDGSPHDWFEGRNEKCTLLVFIDDATSKAVWLEFVKSESTKAVMQATRNYVTNFGIPKQFYVDFGGVFRVNTNNPDHEKITQWERCCSEMGINVTHAHSPQAKGRVERANKTFQDRLVKELRLAGINSKEEANSFIQTVYIDRHNKRFALPALSKGNVHRSIKQYDLEKIFCLKEKRVVQNDFTILYKNRVLQLHKQQKTIIRPKNQIIIHKRFDKSINLFIRQTPLYFEEIFMRKNIICKKNKIPKINQYHKPGPLHPWRRPFFIQNNNQSRVG